MKPTSTILVWCLLVIATGCRGRDEGAGDYAAGGGRRARERYDTTVLNEIESLVHEGDIVFRRGGGLTSRAVLLADTDGIYSHVGIIVEGGEVVHIVPGEEDEKGVRDVIKREGPRVFFERGRALKGAVMRVRGDSTVVHGAAKRAASLAVGTLAFDHDYNLDDTTRMYCTELVWRVFERAGLDLTEGRRTKINMPGFRGAYILPTDITNSSDLELIYRF